MPLLFVATPVMPDVPPRVSRVATATVRIIKLEPVSAKVDPKQTKPADRQYSQREKMPLVEFY